MSIIFLTYAIYRRILETEAMQIAYREVDIIPRPRKCRKVCQLPRIQEFHPLGPPPCGPAVILSVDEYEAIRLIDRQGFSQEECSAYMQVARTTVQLIYNSARKKLAAALVDGLPLRIEGGSYQLCDGKEETCGCGGCRKHLRSCSQKNFMEEEAHEDRSPIG
jgi:predicted DNA-binding protein (UPF0251 family)